jgi:hypothetical protein
VWWLWAGGYGPQLARPNKTRSSPSYGEPACDPPGRTAFVLMLTAARQVDVLSTTYLHRCHGGSTRLVDWAYVWTGSPNGF